MLVDDAIEVLWRGALIPRALRINYRNGSLGTNAQALAARAVHRSIRAGQPQVLEPTLQVIPRGFALLVRDTVRTGAEQDVALDGTDTVGGRGGGRCAAIFRHTRAYTTLRRPHASLSPHSRIR